MKTYLFNEAWSYFFVYLFDLFIVSLVQDDNDASEPTSYVYLDKVSIKLMLNVAECIRVHNQK